MQKQELTCRDNKFLEKSLTVGRAYKVFPNESSNSNQVIILNDNNEKMKVNVFRFH